jgi:rod shape-determining protein MreB
MRGICIDLGTSNTVISSLGKGTLLNEPSFVTLDIDDSIITDAGLSSKAACGKTPENLTTIAPLQGGVIADYSAAEGMVKLLVKKAFKRTVFTGVNAIISVPSSATQMERRAAAETLRNLGVSTVYVIEGAMAAAVGAGINVNAASGSMVVDIGGGTTDAAVIALGNIATGISIKKGGNDMDNAIAAYVKRKMNVLIGQNTAEKIKIEHGCAISKDVSDSGKYKGRDIFSGLPREFTITSEEVREAISDVLEDIIESINIALEKTPSELLSNVMESGITLTGGCSGIYGIANLISDRTSFKASVAGNPSGCTLRGEEKVLNDKRFRLLRQAL